MTFLKRVLARTAAPAIVILLAAAAVPAVAHAGGSPGRPSISICYVDGNTGQCSSGLGWMFQCGNYAGCSTDPCGATQLWSQAVGTVQAVWIDDTVPSSYSWNGITGRQGMAECAYWEGYPQWAILAGCYINGSGLCKGSDGRGPVDGPYAMNIGEWYPYHQGLTVSPVSQYGSCANNFDGQLNGFLTQQDFGWEQNSGPQDSDDAASRDGGQGWDNDHDWASELPTNGESATEWGDAIRCATAYDEPMGTF